TVSDTHLSCDDRPARPGSMSKLDSVSFRPLDCLEVSSHFNTFLGDDLIRFHGAANIQRVKPQFRTDVCSATNVQVLFQREASRYSQESSNVHLNPSSITIDRRHASNI